MVTYSGTCRTSDPRSARWRGRRFRQSRNGGAAPREVAGMRLYEDAGMGCGAWEVDVVDGLMGWVKIGGAKIHKISFVERFNWGYIGCMEYTYSFHLTFQ